MGADKTPDHLRGLLIPDPRFTYAGAFSKSASAFTENTPRPGVPVALDNSDLIVETSGTQGSGSSKEYTLYTQNSGYPEDLGGTFLHHKTVDTDTYKYIGWEPPHTISGLETVHDTDSNNYRNFDIVTAQDDALIIAGVADGSPIIKVWHKTTLAGAWTEVTLATDFEPGMFVAHGGRALDNSESTALEVGSNPSPALVVLPSGRVLLFAWIQIAKEVTTAPKFKLSWQIAAWFSDDSGASWAKYQDYCLVEPLTQSVDTYDGTDGRYYPGRLRAEYKDGQILMISSAYDNGSSTAQSKPAYPDNIYLQYASSSLGASFELVESSIRGNGTTAHDIAVSGGSFVVSYVAGGSIHQAHVTRLGSAYTPLGRGTDKQIALTYGKGFAEDLVATSDLAMGRADLTICAVPDGSMYLCGTRHGSDAAGHTRQTVAILHSGDNGESWNLVGGSYGDKTKQRDGLLFGSRLFDEGTSVDRQRDTFFDLAMTWQRGRAVLACRFEYTDPSKSTVFDDGIKTQEVYALYLGGYSNLTIGSIDAAIDMKDRATFARHYLPVVEPDQMYSAWSIINSGTESAALGGTTNPYLEITSGNGSGSAGYRYYQLASDEINDQIARTTTTTDSGMRTYLEFAVDVITGGSAANAEIGVLIRNGNPSVGTKFSIRLHTAGGDTHLSVYDEVPGTPVQKHTGALNLSSGAIPEIRVQVVEKKLAVWYRAYDSDAEIRTWQKAYEEPGNADALTEGALTGKYCQIQWGHLINGGSSTQNRSKWYKLQVGSHDGELAHSAVPRLNDWLAYSAPLNVGGRFYSTAPIYMREGLKIASKDGPAVKGDEWKIDPRHDYPVEAMHTEIAPSPAKVWSSDGISQAIELVWDLDAAQITFAMGPTRALYLGNINFRSCILHGYNGSSWSQIAVIDAAKQVRYHKRGNTITAHDSSVSSDQTGDTFWTFDSLTGCTFNFSDTGAPSVYTIAGNSEGAFETHATKSPVVLLDGDASAEASTGDGQLWLKDICVIIPDNLEKAYQKIKLEIPTTVSGTSLANSTASGNWEIGTIIWGHVAVFGRQYSNGHIRQIQTNSEMFTGTGGQRRAIRKGPARRAVEFSWVDPVDISTLSDTNPSPDYVNGPGSGSDSRIAASVADTPFLMQGLLSRLDGPVTPVVYLPSISAAATSATQIMDPNRMLYGRITTPAHRIENQIGEEWVGNGAGETVTATAIRIEEEL